MFLVFFRKEGGHRFIKIHRQHHGIFVALVGIVHFIVIGAEMMKMRRDGIVPGKFLQIQINFVFGSLASYTHHNKAAPV